MYRRTLTALLLATVFVPPGHAGPDPAAKALWVSADQALTAGLYKEAEETIRRALEMAKEPDLFRGDCFVSLGYAQFRQGRIPEAEAAFLEAKAIYEKHVGPADERIAVISNWLGNVAKDQGKIEEADALYRKALAIREKVSGPDHLATAHCYNNLGNVALDRKEYAEGEKMHRQALAIREKAVGKEHPLSAQSLSHLGMALRLQGKAKEAEECALQSLVGFGKRNPDNPDLIMPLNLMTELCLAQMRWDEAEKHARESLRVLEKASLEQRGMVNALRQLAQALAGAGKATEAAEATERAKALQVKLAVLEKRKP